MTEVGLKTNNLEFARFSYMDTHNSELKGNFTPHVLSIVDSHAPERKKIEQFVKTTFKDSYDAEIETSYPSLLSVLNEQGEMLSALGVKNATGGKKLYLEQFLDNPIEKEIYNITFDENIDRSKIVEVGHLASNCGKASMFLFAATISFLTLGGFRYVVFTGSSFLARYFRILGIRVNRISDATTHNLTCKENNWGSYFEGQDVGVYFGDLSKSSEVLKRVFGTEIKVFARQFLGKAF